MIQVYSTLHNVHLERRSAVVDVGDKLNRAYISNCITVIPPITLIKQKKIACTIVHHITACYFATIFTHIDQRRRTFRCAT